MGLTKHYVTAIQQGGGKVARKEAERAFAILKAAHAKWAADRARQIPTVEARVCPNDSCKLDMREIVPGNWLCCGCGSEVRKVNLG